MRRDERIEHVLHAEEHRSEQDRIAQSGSSRGYTDNLGFRTEAVSAYLQREREPADQNPRNAGEQGDNLGGSTDSDLGCEDG